MLQPPLKAPFPYFGGKSRAAPLVWQAFGDVPNYVEPFAGSLAVLLARPTEPRIETVNDIDCMVSNFWRSVKFAPNEVAAWADWPVNEADLHARHRWLVDRKDFREQMHKDPHYYDAKIAGWWVWGICQWIGAGWCAASNYDENVKRPNGNATASEKRRPQLSSSDGVHAKGKRKRNLEGSADWKKRPVLSQRGGRGVHRRGIGVFNQKPAISGDSGAAGRGIHASGLADKMPKADRGTLSRMAPEPSQGDAILAMMIQLSERLRRVRVCCGDWKRVLGRSVTEKIGITGILLDPPYSSDADRDPSLYAAEDLDVAHRVREWAIKNGDNPKLRIALCGYEGEHEMPESWRCVPWKAPGGYAAAAGNVENADRERIWFSPHCLEIHDKQLSLAGVI